jgi:hypothetical protein
MPTDADLAAAAELLDEAMVEIEQANTLITGADGPSPPDPGGSPEGVDLVVAAFTPPPALKVGTPAELVATVRNAGVEDVAPGVIIGVGFYLDDDTKEVTWASTQDGLPAGAEVVLSSASAPMHAGPWVPTGAGEHLLSAFVDDAARIPEWSETNNEIEVVVDVAEGPPPPEPGAQLFAPGSLWNTRKTGYQFAPGADWLLSGSNAGINNGPYSHPITRSTPADPVHHIDTPNTWGWPAQTLAVNMRDDATPAGGTDGHLCLLNADGRLVDMWILRSTGYRTWRCEAYALHNWQSGSGFGQASPFQSAGVTAAGAPTAAGTITADDVRAGRIDHALCMAFAYNDQGGNGTCWTPQLWPAIANDVGGGPGPLAEGALLLAQGDPPDGLNAAEAALFEACATFGCWVIDKLDGAPMFYGDRSPEVDGAFRGDRVAAIGRTLRMAVTW